MTKRRWLWLVVPVLVVGALAFRISQGKKVDTLAVERGPLIESVVATGRVITPARLALGTQMAGTLAEIRVKEGDVVKAGQVLARLINNEQLAALDQTQRSIAEAQARISQQDQVALPVAEQNRRQAEANLKLAEQDFARVKSLVESKFYSPSKLDESQRSLDNARAAMRSAIAQYESYTASGADTRLQQTRLAQSRAARDLAQAKLDQTRVLAPADGVILTKLAEPGDVVTVGKKLFDMATAGDHQIELQVDEKNLARLQLGQSAQALADAYPAQPFAARVFYIAPGVDAEKGAVEVKLVVAQPPAFIKPDMTVSVEIETGRKAQATHLPDRAVRDLASAQPWVLVVEDGHAVKRAVTLGLKGSGRVEIAAGLKADERVIPPEAGVQVGARVRAGG